MDSGGLVDWEPENSAGAPQSGTYGAAGTPQESGEFRADYSALDEWFKTKPYNREDVILGAAVVSVLILAYAELR